MCEGGATVCCPQARRKASQDAATTHSAVKVAWLAVCITVLVGIRLVVQDIQAV